MCLIKPPEPTPEELLQELHIGAANYARELLSSRRFETVSNCSTSETIFSYSAASGDTASETQQVSPRASIRYSPYLPSGYVYHPHAMCRHSFFLGRGGWSGAVETG